MVARRVYGPLRAGKRCCCAYFAKIPRRVRNGKSKKRKQHTGGVQPPVYEEKFGDKYAEKLGEMVMNLRAATRDENLDEKVLLKIIGESMGSARRRAKTQRC